MKKYLEVAVITFKSQIAYSFDVFLRVVLSFASILLAFILWSVVFREKTEVAGFSFSMMVTYYIISSFLKRLDQSGGIVWQLSSEIREGQFAKYMVKPIKPLWYFVSLSYAKTSFIFIANIFGTIAWALVFKQYFVLPKNITSVIFAVILNILGLNFLILLNYFTAILSFKFIDIGGFNMIKNNFIEFLTGALIPLALLPVWMQEVMKFFPFYYIFYLPSMLYMGHKAEEVPMALLVLTLWIILLLLINAAMYKRLQRYYEGVGI